MNATTIEAMRAKEDADRKEYEARTVGMKDEDGTTYTIASLRVAFDKFHPGDDWKRPVYAEVPAHAEDAVTFCRAVEFFQGDRPRVRASAKGEFGTLVVTSRGYQG